MWTTLVLQCFRSCNWMAKIRGISKKTWLCFKRYQSEGNYEDIICGGKGHKAFGSNRSNRSCLFLWDVKGIRLANTVFQHSETFMDSSISHSIFIKIERTEQRWWILANDNEEYYDLSNSQHLQKKTKIIFICQFIKDAIWLIRKYYNISVLLMDGMRTNGK